MGCVYFSDLMGEVGLEKGDSIVSPRRFNSHDHHAEVEARLTSLLSSSISSGVMMLASSRAELSQDSHYNQCTDLACASNRLRLQGMSGGKALASVDGRCDLIGRNGASDIGHQPSLLPVMKEHQPPFFCLDLPSSTLLGETHNDTQHLTSHTSTFQSQDPIPSH